MADGFSADSDAPSPAELRDGRQIRLSRVPVSQEAQRLVQAVVDRLSRSAGRVVGFAKMRTLARDIGPIIGGLLQGAAAGHVTNAQRGRTASMWHSDGPIGWRAFWERVGELEKLGLVGRVAGVAGPPMFGAPTGRPTRLWATPELLSMVDAAGVRLSDVASHWGLSEAAQKPQEAAADAPLVIVKELPGWASAARVAGSDGDLKAVGNGVRRLNERVSAAVIRGCTFPRFERLFHGDLRLHGRVYVKGSTDTYQNAPKAERASLTIDGKSVCEVDATASLLSVFLAMVGRKVLPNDPYDIGGLPRDAVKQCAVQTLGQGQFLARWARTTDEAVRRVPLRSVQAALCAAYPELNDLPAVLPADLRDAPPPKGVHWAAGQHLVAVEAEILSTALGSLIEAGVVGLPIFDGLVVKQSDADTARRTLAAAYRRRLRVDVRVTVKAP